MTDPVGTDTLRTEALRNQASAIRADATEAEQDWLEVAESLEAAADEVDRLRSVDEYNQRLSRAAVTACKEALDKSWAENAELRDVLERLRVELTEGDPPAAPVIEAMGEGVRETARLRDLLENAPHGDDCWLRGHPEKGVLPGHRKCTCWKADAQ